MHHAQLLRDESGLPDFSHVHPADYLSVSEPKISIDTVRTLKALIYRKPIGDTQVVVVVAEQINDAAQNALLKILEEPPVATHFYFVIADTSRLLPTLLSRFSKDEVQTTIELEDARQFLRQTPAERLEVIAERVKDKDTLWQQRVMSGLQVLLTNGGLPMEYAKDILFVVSKLGGPGASAKMLLEHVALKLPVL